MKTKIILYCLLAIMAGMIAFAIFFPAEFTALLNRPALYGHALFVHIVAITLFFANAVVGMIWERRSLASGRKDVILHTYATVAWIDARLSSPLIILSVIAGLTLSFAMGTYVADRLAVYRLRPLSALRPYLGGERHPDPVQGQEADGPLDPADRGSPRNSPGFSSCAGGSAWRASLPWSSSSR